MLLIGFTTVSTRVQADAMAGPLVSAGLAFCVQVDGPIISHYQWEGKQERTEEFRLVFKFLPEKAARVKEWVLAHHPYEVPEWLVVRAEDVGEKYLSWARTNSSTRPL